MAIFYLFMYLNILLLHSKMKVVFLTKLIPIYTGWRRRQFCYCVCSHGS